MYLSALFNIVRKIRLQPAVLCLLFIILFTGKISAQYYNTAFGKNGTQLKTALHQIIQGHTVLTYTPGVWNAFATTDVKPGNKIWDIYSDIPGGTAPYTYTYSSNQCGSGGFSGEGDCYNREHSWPQTYFNDLAPMNTDLFHIYPTDGFVNNKRGNLPYGKVNSVVWTSQNGSRTGSSTTYPMSSLDVFEPIDSFKGDLARSYFYMSTRYEGEDSGWPTWEMANGAQLSSEAIVLLLSWHHADPVSQKEIARNEAIALLQQNRNPFIDYPIFADCIWGTADCSALGLSESEKQSVQVYPNPCSQSLHLQGLPMGESVDIKVFNSIGQTMDVPQVNTETIQTAMLPPGLYFLQVRSRTFTGHTRFTKQNP